MPDVLPGGRHHRLTGKIYSGGGFMGVKMGAMIKSYFFRQSMLVFTGMPLLIWRMGNLPARTKLKEVLSVITILAFFQMIGQFFWARTNRYAVRNLKMRKLINYHKIIALLLHPVLLVVPRFFESGVAPVDAFIIIVPTILNGLGFISGWGGQPGACILGG